MKNSILLVGLLLFFGYRNQAQNNSVIIDPSLNTNFVVDIEDTLVTAYTNFSCGTKIYTMDLDRNSVVDLTITAFCYMNGWGIGQKISLSSSDSCTFSIDNSVIDTVNYIDSIGYLIYGPATFRMVRIYNMFDTLSINDCLTQNKTYISNFEYGKYPYPSVVWNSLDNWISGDHYIGIRKKIKNINYLGWVKVEVLNYYEIIIKEYALNINLLNINQYKKPSVFLFPNPATDRLTIDCANNLNLKLQICNIIGDCVFQSDLTSGKNELDISHLSSGIYIIRLTGVDGLFQQKLIKN